MNILLKSAKIIDSGNKEHHLKTRDILIKNGIIEKIAAQITKTDQMEVVELENLHVSVGWFDSGVSFGEPGFEERETIAKGLDTAAKSGFADMVLNPNTYPVPDSSGDIAFLNNAANGQATSLYPMGTLTKGGEGVVLAELYDMKNAGAVAFYDFKSPLSNSNLLKIALQYAQNFNGFVYSFPLDVQIAGKGIVNEGIVSTRLGLKGIPALAEELQIARDLFILDYAGGKLHIPTISTANSVKLISDAKKKGLDVSCSVAVHNLFHTDISLAEYSSLYKVAPPLRTKSDAKALLKGLVDGTIDFVTSDHLPMNVEQKNVEFDNAEFGTLGLESAFGALNQLLGTKKSIEILIRGRERYGLTTPVIKQGEKACLTLFEPKNTYTLKEKDLFSTSKNSMFLGSKLKGKAYGIINNSSISLRNQ